MHVAPSVHACLCCRDSSPAELLLAENVTLRKVTLECASTSAPCPKKLSPENTEFSMAMSVPLMSNVAPGSSSAWM